MQPHPSPRGLRDQLKSVSITTWLQNQVDRLSGTCHQITGISGGFIGTLRLSECTGKNRMVCTITMAGVKELESRELL